MVAWHSHQRFDFILQNSNCKCQKCIHNARYFSRRYVYYNCVFRVGKRSNNAVSVFRKRLDVAYRYTTVGIVLNNIVRLMPIDLIRKTDLSHIRIVHQKGTTRTKSSHMQKCQILKLFKMGQVGVSRWEVGTKSGRSRRDGKSGFPWLLPKASQEAN